MPTGNNLGDGLVERVLGDKQLPFIVALAMQNSHYRENGIAERTELEAFSEQYVKDARVAIETIRAQASQIDRTMDR